MLFPGRRTPIATLLESNKGPLWLVVSFPVDLETPIQKLWLGLLIVLLGAVAAAVLVAMVSSTAAISDGSDDQDGRRRALPPNRHSNWPTRCCVQPNGRSDRAADRWTKTARGSDKP